MLKKLFLTTILCAMCATLTAENATGADICVDPGGCGDYDNLQDALTFAQGNNESDTVMVAQGTYNGNFTYDSSQGYAITLRGGYVACTSCAERVINPANTVLAGEPLSSDSVLYLSNSDGGFIWVAGFSVQNGNASADGGGIFAESSASDTAGSVTLATNIITGNTSGGQGGGVYARSSSTSISSGNVSLVNNIITGNTSTGDGGGLYAASISSWGDGGDVTLSGNTIVGNTCEDDNGGGVYARADGGNPTATAGKIALTGNTIEENNGWVWGGGVYAYCRGSDGSDGIVLTNNIITGNEAISDGAGVYVQGQSSSGGDIVVTNNTISGNNILQPASSGIYFTGGNTVNCYNNIIWSNTIESGGEMDIYLSTSGTTNGFNNDYGTMSGSWTTQGGNVGFDPLFIGGTDFHLRPGSGCINAGLNSAPEIPDYDFEGDPRIHNGTADMGADEFVPRALAPQQLLLLHD